MRVCGKVALAGLAAAIGTSAEAGEIEWVSAWRQSGALVRVFTGEDWHEVMDPGHFGSSAGEWLGDAEVSSEVAGAVAYARSHLVWGDDWRRVVGGTQFEAWESEPNLLGEIFALTRDGAGFRLDEPTRVMLTASLEHHAPTLTGTGGLARIVLETAGGGTLLDEMVRNGEAEYRFDQVLDPGAYYISGSVNVEIPYAYTETVEARGAYEYTIVVPEPCTVAMLMCGAIIWRKKRIGG